MPRKKQTDTTAPPPDATGPPTDLSGKEPPAEPLSPPEPTTTSLSEPAAGNGNGEKRTPVYKVGPIATDANNSVEAAVWDHEVSTRDGRTFTVYNVTVHGSWRDADGSWKPSKSFRGSQIYALVYCLQRASDWILAQRDPSNQCPF